MFLDSAEKGRRLFGNTRKKILTCEWGFHVGLGGATDSKRVRSAHPGLIEAVEALSRQLPPAEVAAADSLEERAGIKAFCVLTFAWIREKNVTNTGSFSCVRV